MTWQRKLLLAIVAMTGLSLFAPVVAQAHPMGNFSVNHYSSISVAGNRVQVLYLVDMAEIPTFQVLSSLGVSTESGLGPKQRAAYLGKKLRELTPEILLTAGGRRIPLSVRASSLIFPPGAGELPTERIYAVLNGSIPAGATALQFRDDTLAGRAGWKEIVANGPQVERASVPASSRSRALTIYPAGVTSSPPQDLSASLVLRKSASSTLPPAATVIHRAQAPLFTRNGGWSLLSRGLARKGPSSAAAFSAGRADGMTTLISSQSLSLGVLLLSLVFAFWFGAGHALSPGHGKTIVGAYLVGNRGTARHAVILGLTVTATHTAGVFALGLVTLYLSGFILPDQLYPWLGFLSGLLVAAMGFTLFARRLSALRRRASSAPLERTVPVHPVPLMGRLAPGQMHQVDAIASHTYDLHHSHEHEPGHTHSHVHGLGGSHSHEMPRQITMRSLIGLGISGGLLPCPSALVVLLSAIAFHKVAFGMLLIVAFSLGLATTLTGIGLLVVYSGRVLSRLRSTRSGRLLPAGLRVVRLMPVFSALVVGALGAVIAVGAISPSSLPAVFIHL
jgi:ABC-type nickel/cobalt efflux system permease component RcnA